MKITLNHISVQFESEIIIKDSKAEFESGKLALIKSPSGTGKTSLVNLIGLMETDDHLDYKIDGIQMSKNSKQVTDFRLKHVGFIFQDNHLVETMTVLDNVMLPAVLLYPQRQAKETSLKLLKKYGLEDISDQLVSTISGGQSQRVALARALVNNPDVIIADEPTSSLDDKNAEIVISHLKDLSEREKKVVIVVSHDNRLVNSADDIYTINDKEIVKQKEISAKIQNQNSFSFEVLNRHPFKGGKFYQKHNKSGRFVNTIFIVTSILLLSILAIFSNFGTSYLKVQEQFINTISDKNITVQNDTLDLNNGGRDYDDALSFSEKELNEISLVNGIESIYPYYYFTSNGFCLDGSAPQSSMEILDIFQKKYENDYADKMVTQEGQNSLKIEALLKDEYRIPKKYQSIENPVFLTKDFIEKNHVNQDDILGKKSLLKYSFQLPTTRQ
ncbi:ABC transporter ATP-binding protein [Pseudolactococcus yaeyamensis]